MAKTAKYLVLIFIILLLSMAVLTGCKEKKPVKTVVARSKAQLKAQEQKPEEKPVLVEEVGTLNISDDAGSKDSVDANEEDAAESSSSESDAVLEFSSADSSCQRIINQTFAEYEEAMTENKKLESELLKAANDLGNAQSQGTNTDSLQVIFNRVNEQLRESRKFLKIKKQAWIVAKERCKSGFLTSSTNTLSTGGSTSSSSSSSDTCNLSEEKNDFEDARKDLLDALDDVYEVELDLIKKRYDFVVAEREDNSEDIADLEQEIHDMEDELDELRIDKAGYEDDVDTAMFMYRKAREQCSMDITGLMDRACRYDEDDIQARLDDAQDDIESYSDDKDKLEDQLDEEDADAKQEIEDEISYLKELINELEDRESELRQQVDMIDEKC